MEQVLGDPRPLRFPVAPDAHGAVVDVVSPEDDVNGGVELDAGDFGAAQLHHIVDVMDMVVLNDREHPAHTADDSPLLAVVDVAPADDVAAHLLFEPAMVLAAAYGVPFHLGGALHVFDREVVVVFRVQVLAQGNPRALAVADLAVFDDPALGPVGADHAVLESGGGSPGCGGLGDVEAADSDIPYAGFGGHKALPAYVDLHRFLVGVFPLEVGV